MADRIVVMNAGRVEQVGTPREIYATPASAFVARFIGTPPMNLLPLADLAAAGIALPPGLPPGTLAGLRPEDITPASDGLPVVLLAEEYLGADRLATVRAGGSDIVLRLPATAPALPRRLHLHWPPEALHLFDAAGGRRLATPSPAVPAAGVPLPTS